MLRRFKDRLGVLRDRHGKMSVADPDATWTIYAALGRLHRHDPKLAKAAFPGIHGFVAESVAGDRFGWNAAERDPAARLDILKRVHLDAEKRSFRKHEQGLHFLPIVGHVLAAPQTAEDIGNVVRRARDGDAGGALESLVQAALGAGFPAGRAVGKAAKGSKKKPADGDPAAPRPEKDAPAADGAGREKTARRPETEGKRAPDPDGHDGDLDWSHSESTQRYFDEIAGNETWRKAVGKNREIPTFGADRYKGRPIPRDGDETGALIGEVRLYRENGKPYAIRPDGERVDIGRLPRNATRTKDGGWEAVVRAPDGTDVKVYYNRYGLPEFPARGAFWLPPEVVKNGHDAHRAYVMKQLRDMARSDSKELRDMGLTAEQIKKITQGAGPKELGIRIHHDYRVGRMLIVDEHIHKLAHKGGRRFW